jgi:hypothetical protein
MSAEAEADDDLHNWRIRCTVNDQSFVFDQWQPIWLKGFKPGRNWVQLELIDEAGIAIDNRFNNTVRAIDYQPGGTDTLSRLVRGELDIKDVAGIIDPTYVPPDLPERKPVTEPAPEAAIAPQPSVEQTPGKDSINATNATEPEPDVPDTKELEKPSAVPDAIPAPAPVEPEDKTQPNPFLLPEESLEPAPESLDGTEAQDNPATLREDALDDEDTFGKTDLDALDKSSNLDQPGDQTDEVDIQGLPLEPLGQVPKTVAPVPTKNPDRTAAEEPALKGLLDRFTQWRDQATSAPAPAAKDPSDRFADPETLVLSAPASEPAPEQPAPNLPRVELVEPDFTVPLIKSPQSSEPDSEIAMPESEEPVELPRIEPSRPAPRSPLAPEARPFI